MEIKVDKNLFIKLGIVVAMCVSCFLIGRFVRFGSGGVSSAGRELIEGIVLAGDTADTIADRLAISGAAVDAAGDVGFAILRGIEELQRTNEVQRICLDNIIRETELTQQNLEIIQSNYTGMADAIDIGFQMAIEQSSAYERIIGELRSFIDNSSKDD